MEEWNWSVAELDEVNIGVMEKIHYAEEV